MKNIASQITLNLKSKILYSCTKLLTILWTLDSRFFFWLRLDISNATYGRNVCAMFFSKSNLAPQQWPSPRHPCRLANHRSYFLLTQHGTTWHIALSPRREVANFANQQPMFWQIEGHARVSSGPSPQTSGQGSWGFKGGNGMASGQIIA